MIRKADKIINRTYGFGVDVTGKDPVARFKIAVWKPQPTVTNHTQEERESVKGEGHYLNNPIITVKEIKELQHTFEVETEYEDVNAWVEWVKYICPNSQT